MWAPLSWYFLSSQIFWLSQAALNTWLSEVRGKPSGWKVRWNDPGKSIYKAIYRDYYGIAPVVSPFFPSWWKVKKDTTPTKQGLKAAWMFFGWMGYYISLIFFFEWEKPVEIVFFVLLDGDTFLGSVSWVEALSCETWGLRTLVWVKYDIVQWQKKITNHHKSANQRISINIQNRFWRMNAPKFSRLKETWIFIVWDRGLFGKSWQSFKRHHNGFLCSSKNTNMETKKIALSKETIWTNASYDLKWSTVLFSAYFSRDHSISHFGWIKSSDDVNVWQGLRGFPLNLCIVLAWCHIQTLLAVSVSFSVRLDV